MRQTDGTNRRGGIIACAAAALSALAVLGTMAIAGTAVAAADEENRSASVAKTATPQPDTAAKRTKLAEARQLRPKNAAAAVAETPDLGAPTHNKYVKYNSDGTYWLSLDVTGASRASTEQKHQPADVVLVMDSSASMSSCTKTVYDKEAGTWSCAAYAKPSRWDIAKSAASTLARKLLTAENAALPAGQQVQMSVVDFDTKSTIENLGDGEWTTSSQAVIDSFDAMDVSYTNGGGTNWEAALKNANSLNTARAGVRKYIVFVSDGAPTYRQSGMNTDCGVAAEETDPDDPSRVHQYKDCDYLDKDGVYGSGRVDYKDYNFNAAVNAANARNGATFYAVSTGSEANSAIERLADTIDPAGTYFDGTDASKLAAAFDSIVEQINTNSKYQDVLIKDTLSGYAVSTDSLGGTGYVLSASARDAGGNDVTQTDPAATKMHADYDQQTKQLSLNFDNNTVLSPSVTYTVSILLKPSDAAYRYFIEHSGSYPNTGDPNTDAEGNSTSSGKPGFYSNADNADGSTTAQVYYKTVTQQEGQDPVVGPQRQAAYPKPVIQVKVPSLTLIKGVDNTNAGDKYGAKPSYWKLSATKNNGAYGIQPKNPTGDVTTDGAVAKQGVEKTMLAPGTYTLGETTDAASAYQYFGGYSAGAWSCVDDKGSAVKVDAAANTMNLTPGANVTCTVVNTAKPGAIAWQKVDGNSGAVLGGSEWSLSGAVDGFTAKTVKDNADNDADGAAGSLRVSSLKWGDYTLTETKAPTDYAKSDEAVKVSVLPTGKANADKEFTVGAGTDGKIANTRISVSSLPSTGATTGLTWMIASGVLLAMAGTAYALWRRNRMAA